MTAESSPERRPYESVVNDAISRSFGVYTVGPGNVERVIGLATDDALADLRPHIEAQVRAIYGTVIRPLPQPPHGPAHPAWCATPMPHPPGSECRPDTSGNDHEGQS